MASIEVFYRHLGNRIRQCRIRRALTQTEVGHRLTPPVTRASIANLELGKQRVLAHTLTQLAAVLDVDTMDLLPPRAGHADRWTALKAQLAESLDISPARAGRLVVRLGAPR